MIDAWRISAFRGSTSASAPASSSARLAAAGAEVVGVDWRVPLDAAAARVGPHQAVQGNLDPAVVFAPWPVVAAGSRRAASRRRPAPGTSSTSGTACSPATDPDVLARIVDRVHAWTPDDA